MSLAITVSGSCLCGAIKYRIARDLLTSVNCHCSMCRKAHGAAFRSGAIVPLGPRQHWNVASKAAWFEITDQLPQFPVIPAPR